VECKLRISSTAKSIAVLITCLLLIQMMPVGEPQVTVVGQQQQQQQQQPAVMTQTRLSYDRMLQQYFCERAISVASFRSNTGILKCLGITKY